MKRTILLLALFSSLAAQAQPKFSEPHGLYDEGNLIVTISGSEGTEIRYTTDGSEPMAERHGGIANACSVISSLLLALSRRVSRL